MTFPRTTTPTRLVLAVAACAAAAAMIGAAVGPDPEAPPFSAPEVVDGMKGFPGGLAALPELPCPKGTRPTDASVALGKRLFFDPTLSHDGLRSCASCHSPEHAYTDGASRASGPDGRPLARNSPTILNVAYNATQFWDGRAGTLESQVRGPLLALRELNMASEETVMKAVLESETTTAAFRAAYGEEPSFARLCQAIADFERTLITPSTP